MFVDVRRGPRGARFLFGPRFVPPIPLLQAPLVAVILSRAAVRGALPAAASAFANGASIDERAHTLVLLDLFAAHAAVRY